MVTILNIWSTAVLSKQSKALSVTTNAEIRKGIKRNKTAVSILNMMCVVYAISLLPSYAYLIMTGISLQTDKKSMIEFSATSFSYFNILQIIQPGFNSLLYILKDKDIKRFYTRVICLKKKWRKS